jgi:hypothetical protein
LTAQILAECPTVDLEAGEPYFPSSLPAGALLFVEQGFVSPRLAPPRTNRSIITCDSGAGQCRPAAGVGGGALRAGGFDVDG